MEEIIKKILSFDYVFQKSELSFEILCCNFFFTNLFKDNIHKELI